MPKQKVVVILQARMGATRLPGKPLKKVLDRALLSYQLERLRRAKDVDQIVVATTIKPADDQIVDLCRKEGIPYFRGNEDDVLDRYYQAAKQYGADIVVRVTGDCPLIDPVEVDRVITYFIAHQPGCDYASNSLHRTYPRGLDVEVFSFKQLENIHSLAKTPSEREHVTPYFYLHPERFVLGSVENMTDLSHHRWTVDTPEDFDLISRIITALYPVKPRFGMQDILDLLHLHPDWIKINSNIIQKSLGP